MSRAAQRLLLPLVVAAVWLGLTLAAFETSTAQPADAPSCSAFATREEAVAAFASDPPGHVALVDPASGTVCPNLPSASARPPAPATTPVPDVPVGPPPMLPEPPVQPPPPPPPPPTPPPPPPDQRIAPYNARVRQLDIAHESFIPKFFSTSPAIDLLQDWNTIRDWQEQVTDFLQRAPQPAPCQASAAADVTSALRQYDAAFVRYSERIIVGRQPGLVFFTSNPPTGEELERLVRPYRNAMSALRTAIPRLYMAC